MRIGLLGRRELEDPDEVGELASGSVRLVSDVPRSSHLPLQPSEAVNSQRIRLDQFIRQIPREISQLRMSYALHEAASTHLIQPL